MMEIAIIHVNLMTVGDGQNARLAKSIVTHWFLMAEYLTDTQTLQWLMIMFHIMDIHSAIIQLTIRMLWRKQDITNIRLSNMLRIIMME